MFQYLLENIIRIVPVLSPLVSTAIVLLLGLYIFWKGCTRTRKNNSSVFDTFLVGIIFGAIIGRISYIFTNWVEFSKYIWYWLPYERYGDEMFFFRLLPWRFIKIWDWGVDILLLFVGFAIICTIWILVVKKWRWSHLFPAIFFSTSGMFSFTFILTSISTSNTNWFTQGNIMLFILIIFFILRSILLKKNVGKKDTKSLLILESIFVLISLGYISTVYLSVDISTAEKIGLVSFIIWSIFGLFFYISDTRKATVIIEKVSSVRNVSLADIKQPIRLPK